MLNFMAIVYIKSQAVTLILRWGTTGLASKKKDKDQEMIQ